MTDNRLIPTVVPQRELAQYNVFYVYLMKNNFSYQAVSPLGLPRCELNKDNTHGLVKLDKEKLMMPLLLK